MLKLFLTFDCEDFINNESTLALYRILELLQKYNLRGVFFITGKLGERLSKTPRILEFLSVHEVGYHSNSHSIHPTIFEYTDIESYETAIRVSLRRETAHIDPLTGKCNGIGGILQLRELLPDNEIVSYRAPGFCWSPPHLEALQKLGFRFDFSTNLWYTPIRYREITFYPFPETGYGFMEMARNYGSSILRFRKNLFFTNEPVLTLVFHPHHVVMAKHWDYMYYSGNPDRIEKTPLEKSEYSNDVLYNFELFLKRLHYLTANGLIEITPPLRDGENKTNFTKLDVDRVYQKSISWPTRFFNYQPKYLHKHFLKYFNDTHESLTPF
jgi:hypothetical protein